jgi:hypothetical protein
MPQISACIGSVKEGRLDLLPRLEREVELCGVANRLPLPLVVDAKGHPSLLGVPGVVKSFSKGTWLRLLGIRGSGMAWSACGPLQIFTSGSTA